MEKTGIRVEQMTPDLVPIPEPEEDPLLEVGRDWIEDGDEVAAAEFVEAVESLLRSGEAERVIAVCQQLLGETEDMGVVLRLRAFALRGRKALTTREE
jgi:hypothetical protein